MSFLSTTATTITRSLSVRKPKKNRPSAKEYFQDMYLETKAVVNELENLTLAEYERAGGDENNVAREILIQRSQFNCLLRLTFDGCATAVRVIWDWGWVWKSVIVKNAQIGCQLIALDPSTGSGSTGIVVQNCAATDVTAFIADADGKVIADKPPPAQGYSNLVVGPIYSFNGDRDFGHPSLLNVSWNYEGAPVINVEGAEFSLLRQSRLTRSTAGQTTKAAPLSLSPKASCVIYR